MSTPYEDKRRTNSMDVRRANIYKRIKDVFDQLPDEFLPKELYLFTGIKNVFANRILVASVLADSFKCTIIDDNTPRRRWEKKKKKKKKKKNSKEPAMRNVSGYLTDGVMAVLPGDFPSIESMIHQPCAAVSPVLAAQICHTQTGARKTFYEHHQHNRSGVSAQQTWKRQRRNGPA